MQPIIGRPVKFRGNRDINSREDEGRSGDNSESMLAVEEASGASLASGRGSAGTEQFSNRGFLPQYRSELEALDRAALAQRQWTESITAIDSPVLSLQMTVEFQSQENNLTGYWVRIPYPLISYISIALECPSPGASLDGQTTRNATFYSTSGWFDLSAGIMREMTVDALNQSANSMWTRSLLPRIVVEEDPSSLSSSLQE